MITKAAVARHAGASLAIETLTLDEPREGEVLVRLLASGVSHADLDVIGNPASPFPFVPGGEGAGLVERVGAGVAAMSPGDAVVLLHGTGRRADRSRFFDGDGQVAVSIAGVAHSSFATHCLCRTDALVVVAGGAPLELLAGLGDEVRAAVGAVLEHLGPRLASGIVVAGAGAGGLAAVMAARALGAPLIIVTDPDDSRRTLATELGASLAVHADDDLAAVVRSMTGSGVGFVLDTTGHSEAIAACAGAAAPGGLCGSLRRPASCPDVLDLAGSGEPGRVVATIATWHAEGRFPIEKLISFFPFEHVNDALGALAGNSVIKPVIRFSLGPFAHLDRAAAEGAAVAEPNGEEPELTPAEEPAPTALLEPER